MECGNCTACCTLLPIAAIGKPLNTPCHYCKNNGCSIYDTKPQTCGEFECAYLQGKNIPESLRPDNCGVIFFKRTDRIFTAALLDNRVPTKMAQKQIVSFTNQGYSIVLLSVNGDKPFIITADGHTTEEIYKEYKESLNGYI